MTKTGKGIRPRVHQGDIFREIGVIEFLYQRPESWVISKINFPFIIVLSQDCDLEQDHSFRKSQTLRQDNPPDGPEDDKTQDKVLLSTLVAPLYNVEHVYEGDHLKHLGLRMQKIYKNKTPGKLLRQNQTQRYHFLSFPDSEVPDSVVDFKHFFTVNLLYLHNLRRTNFVCRLSPPYREDVNQRFAAFLGRIGLPSQ